MALWHCPFCGAPQAMAARCWVCHRSSTTCSTCRNFRTSLAADLGYCARDRARAPLTGAELRACWEEGPRRATEQPPAGPPPNRAPDSGDRGGPLDRPNPMRLRGFVPLDELIQEPRLPVGDEPPAMPPVLLAESPEAWQAPTSLFGDAEG